MPRGDTRGPALRAAALWALCALGCRSTPAPAGGGDAGAPASTIVSVDAYRERPIAPAPWLGTGKRGALVRLGARRAVAVADASETRLVVPSGAVLGRWPGSGAIELVAAVDLRGDGAEQIIVGRNGGRGGTASVVMIDPAHPEAPPTPLDVAPSARPTPVAAFVRRGPAGERELYLAAFDSTYFVTVTQQTRNESGFHGRVVARMRMANSFAAGDVDPAPGEEIVAGRMYGDTIDTIGDLQVIDALGAPIPIATTGGVRAVAVADVDGDGHLSVIAADGWDRDYGHKARALLDVFRLGAGAAQPRREPLLDWPRHSTFCRLVAADLDGDGRAEIIALRGLEDAGPPILVRRSADGAVRAASLGEAPVEDVVVGSLDGDDRHPDVLLLGEAPAILRGGAAGGP